MCPVCGLQELVTGCDKCLNIDDDCEEKYLGVSNSDTSNLCRFLFIFIAKRSLLSG